MLSEPSRSALLLPVLHGRDLNLEPAPCSIEVQATKESARAFFQKFQEEDSDQFLYMRLLEEAHFKKSFSINVDCTHIFQFDRALYNKLTSYPTVRTRCCVLSKITLVPDPSSFYDPLAR